MTMTTYTLRQLRAEGRARGITVCRSGNGWLFAFPDPSGMTRELQVDRESERDAWMIALMDGRGDVVIYGSVKTRVDRHNTTDDAGRDVGYVWQEGSDGKPARRGYFFAAGSDRLELDERPSVAHLPVMDHRAALRAIASAH